jgi:ribosomal-protein-alanine N-acetyltransferase
MPTIETPRLLLRPFTETDAPAMLRLNSDLEVMRYVPDDPLTSVEHAAQILRDHPIADYGKHGYGRWAVELKESGEMIGFCGLKYLEDLGEVDLGYRLIRAAWGRGLASEGAQASVRYGFEVLGLAEIIGLVVPENTASVRVLEKCGLVRERLVPFEHLTVWKYRLTRERWSPSPG